MNQVSISFDNLLGDIQRDRSISIIIDNLWEKESLISKLLLVHRNQLFPTSKNGPEFMIKFFFWDNFESISSPETSVIAIASKIGDIERKQSPTALFTNLEKTFKDIRDLLGYYVIRLVRENNDLRHLVSIKDFSFRQMKETLKDFSTVSVTLNKLINELSDFESIKDEYLKSKMRTIAGLDWLKEHLGDFLSMPVTIGKSLQLFPLMGHKIKESLIRSQKLTYDQYAAIINEMYTANVFSSSQSVSWCENCRDEIMIFWSTSKLDPYHSKISCPKCGKMMFTAIAYQPNELFLKCLLFRDGLLAISIGYLLRKEKFDFKFSHKNDSEIDFICTGKKENFLLECKMHRTDVSERGIKDNLKKGINQLKSHAKDYKLKRYYLVVNYPKSMIEEIREDMVEMEKYGDRNYVISILSYEEIPNLLRKIDM